MAMRMPISRRRSRTPVAMMPCSPMAASSTAITPNIVSVVVCAYNAERTMEDCLTSLEKLNYSDYEVIVVNDGSTDRTREIAERFPYARLINQENKGLSAARNVGVAAATGEIVAFTDSDCVADPDWLFYLVAKFLSSDLSAVGGPNFPPPEDRRSSRSGRAENRRYEVRRNAELPRC